MRLDEEAEKKEPEAPEEDGEMSLTLDADLILPNIGGMDLFGIGEAVALLPPVLLPLIGSSTPLLT